MILEEDTRIYRIRICWAEMDPHGSLDPASRRSLLLAKSSSRWHLSAFAFPSPRDLLPIVHYMVMHTFLLVSSGFPWNFLGLEKMLWDLYGPFKACLSYSAVTWLYSCQARLALCVTSSESAVEWGWVYLPVYVNLPIKELWGVCC